MGKALIIGGGGTPTDITVGVLSRDVTAEAKHILKGKTSVTIDSGDKAIEGTMSNNSSPSCSLNCGQSKIIPEGYNPGGTITANSLASQTSATAGSGDIVASKTAYVNGNKVQGTIPLFKEAHHSFTDVSSYNGTTYFYTKPGYYLNSSNTNNDVIFGISDSLISKLGITGDAIVKGRNILGVYGTQDTIKRVPFADGDYDFTFNTSQIKSGTLCEFQLNKITEKDVSIFFERFTVTVINTNDGYEEDIYLPCGWIVGANNTNDLSTDFMDVDAYDNYFQLSIQRIKTTNRFRVVTSTPGGATIPIKLTALNVLVAFTSTLSM